MDYNKVLYNSNKKKKKLVKKGKLKNKIIWIKLGIQENDLKRKVRHVEEFMLNSSVRNITVQIKLRGREHQLSKEIKKLKSRVILEVNLLNDYKLKETYNEILFKVD